MLPCNLLFYKLVTPFCHRCILNPLNTADIQCVTKHTSHNASVSKKYVVICKQKPYYKQISLVKYKQMQIKNGVLLVGKVLYFFFYHQGMKHLFLKSFKNEAKKNKPLPMGHLLFKIGYFLSLFFIDFCFLSQLFCTSTL